MFRTACREVISTGFSSSLAGLFRLSFQACANQAAGHIRLGKLDNSLQTSGHAKVPLGDGTRFWEPSV